MDPNALELGFLQTVLGETDSETGSSSIAKRGELFRRLILNGTTIDSNGFIDFNATQMNLLSFGGLEAAGNIVVSGLFGGFVNATSNVMNFVANVVTFGSNTTFVRDAELQAGASLRFSGNTAIADVRVQRVAPAELAVVANAAGFLSLQTDIETFGRIGLLNDAGGIFLGNGSASFLSDTSISRSAKGVIAIGANGYGDATGNLFLSSIRANTVTSLGTLTIAPNTTFSSNVTVSGFVNVASTLQVTGASSLGTLGAGNTTISGTLAAGNTTVSGTLASGNTTITGTLTASGNTTLNANTHANAQLRCDTTNGRFVLPVGTGLYAT